MLEVPVKPTFFPTTTISSADASAYRQLARYALDDLQHAMATYAWKRVESRDGLLIGKVHCIEQDELDARGGTPCLVMRGAINVRATVPEVLAILAPSTTDESRRWMHRVHAKKYIDGLVLASVASDSANDELRVKWAAFKDDVGPALGRDYCLLEYAGLQTPLSGGPPRGFCVYHSIDRPREVPSLSTFGYRRDSMRRTGFLIVPSSTSPEMVHVTYLLSSSSPRDVPMDKWESALAQRFACLNTLGPLIAQRRLSQLPIADRALWVPDNQRKFCAVCLQSFHFRRKHHCRSCGEVVCASCADHHTLEVPVLGLLPVRLCNVCISKANAVRSPPPTRRKSIVLLEDIQLQLPPPTTKKASLGLPMRAMLEDLYPSQRAMRPIPEVIDETNHSVVPLDELVARISSIKLAIAGITPVPPSASNIETSANRRVGKMVHEDAQGDEEEDLRSDHATLLASFADDFCTKYDHISVHSARTSLLSSSLSSGSSCDEVDALKHQVDELHRMLEDANARLGDYELEQAARHLKYVESQSGNALNDPIVVRRRETYDALLSELHDIMGLAPRLA
ncbi:hypothetical protein SPRG_14575 [Saprolegnia parasitica CBS 223.65]|uniref:FYVE-type domain-containing protein n=1 Tax=Saprolegnia parasitica (strain CBS 223.65) TaxID=695850 RepID=A0A067BT38_SAPPC|nr:hypothetical protein SPRG_14575 [Saprolegnia parasitica CBS 223.65]KDO19995.1 hypothetical protein SPRG_14575 [Saprolegnia parasitica CBS 223.65]|eukprot:XP_012209298.1 hypothetical protein SPRG_14575 [Saprolegnia parasitica CBS 223.65]